MSLPTPYAMINAAAIYIYDKVVQLLDGLIVGVSGFFRGLGYGRVRRIAPWESMHYAKVIFCGRRTSF